MMKNEVFVAPLTVLADPGRLNAIFSENSGLHSSAAYIIRKQLEESDIIAITRTDMYPDEEVRRIADRLKKDFPECKIMSLSSVTGEGVQDWLDTVMTSVDSGKHIIPRL